MRVKFNVPAFMALRRDPGVTQELHRRAKLIADACGGEDDGFHAEVTQGRTRARASVVAVTYQARRRNARDNTMIKALDAGRG